MRVLLIEDHALFREGVTLILKQLGEGIEVECGESADDALALAQRGSKPDLILLDYHLCGSNGLECLHKMQPLCPETPMIMLSAEQDQSLIQAALNAGARGFITKTSSSQVMLSAIQLVLNGGLYVPPEMLQPQNNDSATARKQNPLGVSTSNKQYHLTSRQLDVLRHMLDGQSNKEIARELNMSPSTVKVHVAAILRELDVKNRTQAVNIAKSEHILG
ncbi:response regulator [Agaribacterium haliotis]|uniref:response regulator n=1 Tax=Agaribacterium haliotis TaxID=2013869 RepID=UPI000BB5353F|nr:response regulator transcription factor [Agaribacterium haliotis]